MNIYLVRHGDDDENYRGGWSNLPLIQTGIEKSEKLAQYLKKENIKIDKIISSDLRRAKMTADIISSALNIEVISDQRLRENNNGVLAGMENKEAIEKYPNVFFSALDYEERFPEGESPKEFYERIKRDYNKIIKENKNVENLMLVTHAGVINIIIHLIENISWSNKEKKLKIPPTSVTKIIVKNNKSEVCYIGQTPHLD